MGKDLFSFVQPTVQLQSVAKNAYVPIYWKQLVAMTQHWGVRGTGALRGELGGLVYGALIE